MDSGLASLVVATSLSLAIAPTTASAQDIASETYNVDASEVTIYLHDFLTETDIDALRILAQSTDALALFISSPGTFGAVAVAPGEGFLVDGIPAESVVAISDLPSAEDADLAAREACDELRSDTAPCVVTLAVAPR